jgi:hypothetical protein
VKREVIELDDKWTAAVIGDHHARHTNPYPSTGISFSHTYYPQGKWVATGKNTRIHNTSN